MFLVKDIDHRRVGFAAACSESVGRDKVGRSGEIGQWDQCGEFAPAAGARRRVPAVEPREADAMMQPFKNGDFGPGSR
jgi:hypothetical protein